MGGSVAGVSIESRLSVATPEGVRIDIIIAGLGSRFLAAVLDTLIMLAIMIAPLLVVAALFGDSGWSAAFALIWMFLAIFGYYPFFETIWAGRTIGKRAAGIRVVGANGSSIGFVASAVRNLVRIVDFLPFFYGVGTVSILVTNSNQRLGDLAASTYVIRERSAADRAVGVPSGAYPPTAPGQESYWGDPSAADTPVAPTDRPWLSWDVSAVTQGETALTRRFLERRWQIEPHARAHLAADLAARLRPKVPAAPAWPDETFLECVVATKSSRG